MKIRGGKLLFTWKEKDNLKYLEVDEMGVNGIKAVFTSRLGGISGGNYASLNLGLHTKDKTSNVLANRRKIATALQLNLEDFVAAEQVHGNNIYIVTEEDRGKGALELANSIASVDSLITASRGIPLISFYADCVPLLISDPVKKVVALAHAGWKGTVLEIGAKTVIKMRQIFGTNPRDCIVAIGPSISKSNYEVDDAVVKHFQKFTFYNEIIEDRGKGHYNLDLKKANLLSLKRIGLLEKNIIVSKLCTYDCNQLFYSYRREAGKTGRMASIIMIL